MTIRFVQVLVPEAILLVEETKWIPSKVTNICIIARSVTFEYTCITFWCNLLKKFPKENSGNL